MSLILTLAQLLHACALVSFLDANARTVHDGNSDAAQQQCLSSRGSSWRLSLETTIRRTCGKPRGGEPTLSRGRAWEYFVSRLKYRCGYACRLSPRSHLDADYSQQRRSSLQRTG